MVVHPSAEQIKAHARQDLEKVYMLAFDNFAIVPMDIVIDSGEKINSRYARELLGILKHGGLIDEQDVNNEGIVWQVIDPGTTDDVERDVAEARIREWLDEHMPLPPKPAPTPIVRVPGKTNTITPKEKKMSTATATKPEKVVEFRKCLCGCDSDISGKSQYKPGHDARHAGNVARAILNEDLTPEQATALLDSLGSDALRAKANAMVENWTAKAEQKAAREVARKAAKAASEEVKAQAKAEVVWTDIDPVRVGRWDYPARINNAGFKQRNTKKDGSGEWVDVED